MRSVACARVSGSYRREHSQWTCKKKDSEADGSKGTGEEGENLFRVAVKGHSLDYSRHGSGALGGQPAIVSGGGEASERSTTGGLDTGACREGG